MRHVSIIGTIFAFVGLPQNPFFALFVPGATVFFSIGQNDLDNAIIP
jgi:hypothetical protein